MCKGVDVGDEIFIIKRHAHREGIVEHFRREKACIGMEGVERVCKKPASDVRVGCGEMKSSSKFRKDLFAEDRFCVGI